MGGYIFSLFVSPHGEGYPCSLVPGPFPGEEGASVSGARLPLGKEEERREGVERRGGGGGRDTSVSGHRSLPGRGQGGGS